MSEKRQVPEGYKKTEMGVVPEEWRIFQVDQLANINGESRDPTKNSEELFYYIDIDAVENGSGLIKNPKRLSGKEAPSRARRVIHKDNVIMSTVRPYHKAFALVPQVYENQICSTGFAVLSCGKNIDPKYLLQYLFSDKVIDQCTAMMAGGQYPALNTSQVSKIKIAVPSLPEQQKIATILSKVDEQIEQTEQIIEKTETLKKGLMQKLLTRGIGHTKFKNTVNSEVPYEWKIVKLGDKNCSQKITQGPNPNYSLGLPSPHYRILKTKDLYDYEILYENADKISKEIVDNFKNFILEDGDVLVAIVGRGSIGKSNIFKEQDNIVYLFTRALGIIRVNKEFLLPLYVHYFLQTPATKKILNNGIAGSTGQEVLQTSYIKNIKIPIPSLEEQQKIASILSKADSQIQDNQNYLTRLQELKKGLMQDLLTGKVRVCV